MDNLKISYPFKPFSITQHWGTFNEAYAKEFNDPTWTRHNGIDAKPYFTDVTFPLYCPVEGFVVESVSYEPHGGGNQISLVSKTKVKMFETECYARIWFCHAKKVLVKVGYEPALGELLMIANNTGFSTGPHTHMGLYRLDDKKRKLDTNAATGSFDPALFFTGKFAEEQSTVATRITSGMRYWRYLVGLPV